MKNMNIFYFSAFLGEKCSISSQEKYFRRQMKDDLN